MEQAPPTPAVSHRPAAAADLSDEIILQLDRQPEDRVTCRWIFGDKYRCNWWAPSPVAKYDNPAMDGLTVTTHRVRQSRFVTATKTAGGLVISPPSRKAGAVKTSE